MEGDQAGGKRSAWMSHVKKTMKANKGMKLMQVLKMAKKTYKKTGGGGLNAMPLGQEGARRRRGGDEPVSFGKRAVAADAAAAQDEAKMTFGGRRRSRKAGRKGGRRTRKH